MVMLVCLLELQIGKLWQIVIQNFYFFLQKVRICCLLTLEVFIYCLQKIKFAHLSWSGLLGFGKPLQILLRINCSTQKAYLKYQSSLWKIKNLQLLNGVVEEHFPIRNMNCIVISCKIVFPLIKMGIQTHNSIQKKQQVLNIVSHTHTPPFHSICGLLTSSLIYFFKINYWSLQYFCVQFMPLPPVLRVIQVLDIYTEKKTSTNVAV